MLLRFIALIGFLSSVSYASHLETVCKAAKQPVPNNPNSWQSNPPSFDQNYVTRRMSDEEGTRYVLEDFSGNLLFESSEKISGVSKTSDRLWLLAQYSILELTFSGELLEEHPLVFNPIPNEPQARAFALVKDLLIVARGQGGLVAFNIATKKIAWHTELRELAGSIPVALAFDGINLQVLMTGNREGAFNGVATLAVDDAKLLNQTAYDLRRAGVIFPYAKAEWFNNSLIINNGGWIHQITAKQLNIGKPVRPRWIAVEAGDDTHLHYMMLEGEFFFRDNSLYGCGVYNERNGNDITRAARLFIVPMD